MKINSLVLACLLGRVMLSVGVPSVQLAGEGGGGEEEEEEEEERGVGGHVSLTSPTC